MRSRVRPILILLLTVGLLAFSFRNANLRGVWAETRRADAVPLLSGAGVDARHLCAPGLSLAVPAGAPRPTRFSIAFRATVIGFAASFLLPARAGEVIRPFVLARREGLSAPAAFATIILERLLDLLVVLLLFALFVLTAGPGLRQQRSGRARPESNSAAPRAVVAALAGRGFLLRDGRPSRPAGAAGPRLEAILPARLSAALAGFVKTFTQGLAVLRQPRPAARVAGAVLSALAVDRRRDLADITGLSYYVSLSRLRSW